AEISPTANVDRTVNRERRMQPSVMVRRGEYEPRTPAPTHDAIEPLADQARRIVHAPPGCPWQERYRARVAAEVVAAVNGEPRCDACHTARITYNHRGQL